MLYLRIYLVGMPVILLYNFEAAILRSVGDTKTPLIALATSGVLEVLSGYLRGFGISVVPAALTMRGVCGIRIAWIKLVFPQFQTFRSIMQVYPISLCTTALLLFAALVYYRPAKKFARIEKEK